MVSKCPKCQNMVGSVRAEQINITNNAGNAFAGAAYTCPHCQTILSVTVDPFAFKNEIAIELMKRMRAGGSFVSLRLGPHNRTAFRRVGRCSCPPQSKILQDALELPSCRPTYVNVKYIYILTRRGWR